MTKRETSVFRPGPCKLQIQNVLHFMGEECEWAREDAGHRVVRGDKGWGGGGRQAKEGTKRA